MYIAETKGWYLERVIWLVAGVVTLTGALLAWLVSLYWLILIALVGINLLVFALTGFCVMANILYKLGIKPRCEDESVNRQIFDENKSIL